MRTIGTCDKCKSFTSTSTNRGFCEALGEDHGKKFGCIHWESKQSPTLPNYPASSAQERLIKDLQRENDAALEQIVKLSRALVALGYDPTQLP